MMRPTPALVIDAFRRMAWFDGSRARAYRVIIFAVPLFIALFTVLTAKNGIDRMGTPIGADFTVFWTASSNAISHGGNAMYVLLYPPPFLLLTLPLGLLPYFPSLVLWVLTTGGAFWLMMRRWLSGHPDAARTATFTILAFPAVLINAGNGQNGFLTAALLGGGLWLLDRRPIVAGALLGMLIIKPQMAIAIPILVLASGRWRVMFAGAASALGLCGASWLIFGQHAWSGFFANITVSRGILEHGLVDPAKMVSTYAATQVLHAGATLGYALQGLVAVSAAILLAVVARRRDTRPDGQAALCAVAGTLMSPYFFDYDLTIIAIPLAWLFLEGLRRGFLPWEKLVLVSGFLLPLVVRDVAIHLRVPIAPFVMIALFATCARAAVWRPAGVR